MNEPKSPPFEHPENITVGKARIIYAVHDYGWVKGSGWHLPGGTITNDRSEAYAYAVRMNAAMGGVSVLRDGV